MKICHKKNFWAGAGVLALGILNLATALWRGQMEWSDWVLVLALVFLGGGFLLRGLSPKLAREDRIEEQDERNVLVQLKTRTSAFRAEFFPPCTTSPKTEGVLAVKKIENKFNFVLACLMAAVALACLTVYFLAAIWGKGKDPALLAAAFVVAVWAVTDFYDAFHKKPIDERVAGQADERDVYLAMKSSRTAMMIFNKSLFLASVLAFWVYARFGVAFLLPVAVTLAAAVLFLFLLLLCVNLYYEKRG